MAQPKSIPAEQLTFLQYSNNTSKSDKKRVLCISPNLEDVNLFAGVWHQNVGLLRIASYLKNVKRYHVDYIDGLNPTYLKDRCKIPKKLLERRDIGGVRKSVYLWGYSYEALFEQIKRLEKPDKIYMGVTMTYHYRSVFRITKLLKQMYPNVPVVIGGISPTLIPDWYKNFVKREKLKGVTIISGDWKGGIAKNMWTDFDLLRSNLPNFALVATSHGCPFNCSFCAAKTINPKVILRNPSDVVAEMKEKYSRYGIKKYFMFDDNPVHKAGKHLEEFLDLIIQSGMKLELDFGNGISPQFLTENIIKKMHKAGVKRLTFGFETSDKAMHERFKKKHTMADLYRVKKWAWRNGFKRHDGISFFTLMAMPDQSLDSVVESILEAMKFGALPIPKEYTPIPCTSEWEKYGHLVKDKDPFDLIGDFYPFAEYNKVPPVEYEKLQCFVQGLRKMQSNSFGFKPRLDLSSDGMVERALRHGLIRKATSRMKKNDALHLTKKLKAKEKKGEKLDPMEDAFLHPSKNFKNRRK